MNVREGFGIVRGAVFRTALAARRLLPRRRVQAFGPGDDRIGAILAINLDRQPARWHRLKQELDRFLGHDGNHLVDLADRLPAIDARDGRETAPTADVDPIYTMGDQLFVQPDSRLEECFGRDEAIRMTRQEIAVARSHIEAWKRIARGAHEYVLVLEDDVYFVRGAARLIDRGWRAALQDRSSGEMPQLLYLSYLDAGGTAEREHVAAELFRPVRGFWYASGYVLSRSGAELLLRAMPVVGPVDLWMNHRFADLRVLALSRSALLQRRDGGSDNAYSIVPYLARSGVVDAGPGPVSPAAVGRGFVFAWNVPGATDSIGMALSTLGYRVRTFSTDACPVDLADIFAPGSVFDAYVDANLDEATLSELVRGRADAKFIIGAPTEASDQPAAIRQEAIRCALPADRTVVTPTEDADANCWEPLCRMLGLAVPDHAFPRGVPHDAGLFHTDDAQHTRESDASMTYAIDESPWVLPISASWRPRRPGGASQLERKPSAPILNVDLSSPSTALRVLSETFPGNMATFGPTGVQHGDEGATLVLRKGSGAVRPLSSGALASSSTFTYGRFEAEIRPARGAGLVTGFFLHRDLPRQEIDVELLGSDPQKMLVNVYFNPGDEGTAMAYGYRGTPYAVDLGFDASAAFHTYAVEWTPNEIRWLVDGRAVHVRSSWDPTPIPHLAMRLHANLWSPRSIELAGKLREHSLPAHSTFRRISVQALDGPGQLVNGSNGVHVHREGGEIDFAPTASRRTRAPRQPAE
jgi:GR25 family glycosyltransferase involved in LPS biosynthesis